MISREAVNMFWQGRSLSPLETLAISSFIAHGHPVVLWSYETNLGEVPEGVELRDAVEILPKEALFSNRLGTHGAGGYPGFSDWFRYELLAKVGGWWSDTDMVLLRPLEFDAPIVIASGTGAPLKGRPTSDGAECCILRFPVAHPAVLEMAEFCRSVDIPALVQTDYIAVGPGLLKRISAKYKLEEFIVDRSVFWPVSWAHVSFFVKSPLHRYIYNLKRRLRGGERVGWMTRDTVGVHLCHSFWSLSGIDTNGQYSHFSFYEAAKRRYLGR